MSFQFGIYTLNQTEILNLQNCTNITTLNTDTAFLINCASSMNRTTMEGKSRFDLARAYINALYLKAVNLVDSITLCYSETSGHFIEYAIFEDAQAFHSHLTKRSTTDEAESFNKVVEKVLDDRVANQTKTQKPLTLIIAADDIEPSISEIIIRIAVEVYKQFSGKNPRELIRIQFIAISEDEAVIKKFTDLRDNIRYEFDGKPQSDWNIVDVTTLRMINDFGGIGSFPIQWKILAAAGCDRMGKFFKKKIEKGCRQGSCRICGSKANVVNDP